MKTNLSNMAVHDKVKHGGLVSEEKFLKNFVIKLWKVGALIRNFILQQN